MSKVDDAKDGDYDRGNSFRTLVILDAWSVEKDACSHDDDKDVKASLEENLESLCHVLRVRGR